MHSWQEELVSAIGNPELSAEQVFERIGAAARALGFEHVAYGVKMLAAGSDARMGYISDYPSEWQRHYEDSGYLSIDPTVAVGQRSYKPLLWSDSLFAGAKPLWDDARESGLRHGWAQSSRNGQCIGLFTLARSTEPIGLAQLQAHEADMRWLADTAHLALSRRLTPQPHAAPSLTDAEAEVLRWAADGLTSQQIADKLNLADDVVKHLLASAMRKLDVSSHTAASVKAELLRVLGPRMLSIAAGRHQS